MPFSSAFSLLRPRASSTELAAPVRQQSMHSTQRGSTFPSHLEASDSPAAYASLPLSTINVEQAHAYRTKFTEEGLGAAGTVHSQSSRGESAHDTSKEPLVSSRDLNINPASIPTRTSSSNATESPRSIRTRRSLHSHSRQGSRTQNSIPEEPQSPSRTLMSAFPTPPRQLDYGVASPVNGKQDAAHDLINGSGSIWSAEKENILNGPFAYLEQHPGKDIRGEMIAAFNNWLQVPSASLEIITKVVGMLHTASLLIDDVEDSSTLRRGVPVAHSIFGTAQTINSANYVYFCALQELLRLSNPETIRIYTEELLNLHRGQGMDLFWRDTLTCPSEDDYLEMVGNKTGGLFRLAIKLMCAESLVHNSALALHGQPQNDYVPLVNTIGLLFQILDDYRNLSDSTYTANKGLCEDLTEGKFSFPIIHSIRTDPSNLVLINILKQKTQDDDVKRYAVSYMERTGSFAYTRRVLRGLTKKALTLVDELDVGRGRGEGIKNILEKLRIDKHARSVSDGVR